VALGVPSRLRSRIFSTFGTTRVVGRQPSAPAAFTPEEVPGTHFQMLSRPQGTWFCRKEPRKKSPVTPPGIDPGIRLVAQRLNHYATSAPLIVTCSSHRYFNDRTKGIVLCTEVLYDNLQEVCRRWHYIKNTIIMNSSYFLP
jgi:hypothetical protein